MEFEQSLVGAMLKERTAYEEFERIGNLEDFSPIARSIVGIIGGYYGADPGVHSCKLDIIRSRALSKLLNEKHHKPVTEFLGQLEQGVSAINVVAELRSLHKAKVGQKLSLALANGQSEEEVQKLIAEYGKGLSSESSGQSTDLVDALDTADLTEEKANVEYIKLWPKSLNDRLDGGALRGHHIIVFARPEGCKTLFSLNLCAGFAHQGLNILSANNEEPSADIRDRFRGRLLKWSKQEVRAKRNEAADRLSKASLGKLSITDSTSFADIRKTLKSGHYDVLVIDQVRNMRIKSEGRTAELEAAGIEARAIAKEHNVLVVSVTQAGDSASGKVFLDMNDIDSSKTGLPASADLIIGLGSDAAMKLNGLLGVSLSKNKMSGLHDRWTVQCNFQTGEVI